LLAPKQQSLDFILIVIYNLVVSNDFSWKSLIELPLLPRAVVGVFLLI